MSPSGQCRKIFVGLDVDYTLFETRARGTSWIGGKEHWIDFCQDIADYASNHNIEIIFGIVTAKNRFDSLCRAAAEALQPFLGTHNDNMYLTKPKGDLVLINCQNKLSYEYLSPLNALFNALFETERNDIPENAFSHFEVVHLEPKSAAIKRIAAAHKIPLNQCILIDDSPWVIKEVEEQGICGISVECFNPQNPNNILEDEQAIGRELYFIKSRLALFLMDKIKELDGLKLIEDGTLLDSPPRPISPAFEATLSLESIPTSTQAVRQRFRM